MASTGLKEYTLRINGVDASIKDVTKLEAAVNSLDSAVAKSNKTTTTRAKALTDEEKAANRLEAAQNRLARINSEVNRQQIQTNIAIREQTRELTRSIQISQLAEGSVRQMGMTITDLRNEYENLSAAERISEETGGALLKQIQALDAEYKSIRESTGNFRDSVGNYGRAIEGLKGLSVQLKDAGKASVSLAGDMLGSSRIMSMFGANAGDVNEGLEDFNKIMIIAVGAQSLYTAVTQEGIVADGIALGVSATRTVQLKAQTAAQVLATKGTVGATIAQKAFNIVASANPYVLLALAITSVGLAMFAFANRTDDAARKQSELNELQAVYLDQLEREGGKLEDAGEKRVRQAERELAVLQAQGAGIAVIRQAEDRLAIERAKNNARQRGFYGQELDDLDTNRKKLEDLTETLRLLNTERAKGNEKTFIDIEGRLDTKRIDPIKIEEAIDAVQGKIDNLNKSVSIAVSINSEQEEIDQQARIVAATRIKEATELAKTRRDIEIAATREAEDARIATTQNEYERQIRTTVAMYDRQIEDLKLRLSEEKNLTEKARKEINETIYSLDLLRFKDLDALQKEQGAKELETLRAAEDSKTALIVGQLERRTVEINIAYDRQIEDLQRRLDDERGLTLAQRDALTEMILDAEIKRGRELEAVTVENLERSAALQIKSADATLKAIKDQADRAMAREGLELIDVDKTRDNLARVSRALGDYVAGVRIYQSELTEAYTAATAAMDKNSLEYEEATLSYVMSMDDATQRINNALLEQDAVIKRSKGVQLEYFKELFERIGEYAEVAFTALSSVLETWSMGLGFAIDNLNEELDVINDKFDKAQEQREKAVENVEKLEERLQAATGGTSDAIRAQLQDAMHARQDAEREEVRLAREKEKREAEIARKEKQLRRNDLVGGIAQGIANTAEAITKALTLVWPLNLVVASVVGAAGAAQVGVMTNQLTKLQDGGEIVGPSHDDGGVNINVQGKPSYEAQGGEFMVNDVSYGANKSLVNFINDADGPLSLADLAGFFDTVPATITDNGAPDEDRMVEALERIERRPVVVSVVDINDAQEQVAAVQDLSGFD